MTTENPKTTTIVKELSLIHIWVSASSGECGSRE